MILPKSCRAIKRPGIGGVKPLIGGDGFEAVEIQGVGSWLAMLQDELRSRSYAPQPLLRVRSAYFHITQRRCTEVVDADLSDYFSTIPHGPLMRCVSRRVTGGTVNDRKTRLTRIPEESFDFLGYTVGRFYGKDGRAFIGTVPSRKAIQRVIERIHDETTSR